MTASGTGTRRQDVRRFDEEAAGMVSSDESTVNRVDDRAAPDTTAAHVCHDVPRVAPEATCGEARVALSVRPYESVADIAVCRADRLVGLVPAEVVLGAPDERRIDAVMDTDPPLVAPGTDQEVAAWKAVAHGETSLAVVDGSGSFVGLVPPRRLLAVLLAEHEEDLVRLSGVLRSTGAARRASEEPVGRRIVHRLPWLVLGLLGGAGLRGDRALVRGRPDRHDRPGLLPARGRVHGRRRRHTDGSAHHPWAVGRGTDRAGGAARARDRARRRAGDRGHLPAGRAGRLGDRCRAGRRRRPVRGVLDGDRGGDAAPLGVQPPRRRPRVRQRTLATVVQDVLSLLIYFVVASAIVG
jgi:CBS domain-containing protein